MKITAEESRPPKVTLEVTFRPDSVGKSGKKLLSKMEITHVPAKQTGGQEAEKIAEGK